MHIKKKYDIYILLHKQQYDYLSPVHGYFIFQVTMPSKEFADAVFFSFKVGTEQQFIGIGIKKKRMKNLGVEVRGLHKWRKKMVTGIEGLGENG